MPVASALNVRCPRCNSLPGSPCVAGNRRKPIGQPHPQRVNAAGASRRETAADRKRDRQEEHHTNELATTLANMPARPAYVPTFTLEHLPLKSLNEN